MLVDEYGNKISTESLQEPQTSRVSSLRREFAEHPSRGLNPARLARLLEDAERGHLRAQCELAEDMEEKDAHLFAELAKRQRALLGVPWHLEAPRNASKAEQQATELLSEILQDMNDFEDVLLGMADAIHKGYACLEYTWARAGKQWTPARVTAHPSSWFVTEPEAPNELRLRRADGQSEALQPYGWMVHLHQAKNGYVARSGLVRVLAWPYLFKNYAVRDLAEFLEIYGLPLRLGTYPIGSTKEEKATLLNAVVNIGHAAAGIIPQGMAIEFKEAAKGASDPFECMVAWAERSMSKAILGGTLTSQADGKSSTNALGQVHNEVRRDLRNSDLRQLASTLNRDLLLPLTRLNTTAERAPRLVFDIREPEDLKAYADALPNLVKVGFKIPRRWAHEQLQIPEPQGNEDVLGLPPAAATTAPVALSQVVPGRGLAVLSQQPVQFPAQAALDAVMVALDAGTLNTVASALLTPVLTLAQTQPEALLGQLAELYPQMDDSLLQEQLARLLFVAETWGRLNANAE